MKQPCIAVDVSKESSHIQGFYRLNDQASVPIEISHNNLGFGLLRKLMESMYLETSKEVVVVYEDTGVYDKPLRMYLTENSIRYSTVNPLVSARYRKQNLRAVKTDKKDCSNIAKVYFNEDLKHEVIENTYYSKLRKLNRYYEEHLDHSRKYKVNFKETLDTVWPGFNGVFSNVFTELPLAIIEHYGHPYKLRGTRKSTLTKFIKKNSKHSESWCEKKALTIICYANSIQSGCVVDDILISILQDKVSTIKFTLDKTDKYLTELIQEAKKDPNFVLFSSIPGIGENLAAILISEIGDIFRFNNERQLIAYAGLDPKVYESGSFKGKFSISKKGNKRLRSLLYLAISCSLRAKLNSNIFKDYYKRKTQQGKLPKVVLIACCNKLLRVIYAMCNTGTLYKY